MCGIAGYTHGGRAVDENEIRRMGGTLVHRGPDQQGVYHSRDVSLAAVRLKIIDLDGGDQPLATEDGRAVIVFNGEIYNYADLRRELESLGHHFTSNCDTEVVVRAFVEWNTESFERLLGMFALAIWQPEEGRLVLARDRIGIKPLYLHQSGRDLYFASELKALFECGEVPRRLDLTALDGYLALNFVPQPHTLVNGITKLAPGEYLEWHDGKVRRHRYWQLKFAPSSRWRLEEAKKTLDGLLRQSVRQHLVSDVPLGVWSSGGLDSSAILHYAAEASSSRLKTFSVSFQGRSFDESKYFREVAAQYGTEHHEFDLNPEVELADAVEQFAYYSDEPSADAGALPVWFLSRMSRQFVTVALSGDGGDELFGGYATYLADRYARWMRWSPRWMRRSALALSHLGLPVSDEKISFEYKVKRMLEGSLLPADEAHFFWNGTGSPEQRAALLSGRGGVSLADLAGRAAPPGLAAGYLNRYLLIDHHYYLPDDILYKVDRMSMAHSLEVRPPFLDHRIVEFAASLPEHHKIRGGTLKFLLRELMKDKLPPSVIRRSKMGFDVPAHDWFRGPLKTLLLDTVTMDSVQNTGVFSWPAVERLIADHLERRRNYGYHLWGLLTLFLWMRQWKIGTALEPTAEQALAAS